MLVWPHFRPMDSSVDQVTELRTKSQLCISSGYWQPIKNNYLLVANKVYLEVSRPKAGLTIRVARELRKM